MHIRVAHETCACVQVVFNSIPAAEEFLAEITQRDDVFLARTSAAMVFFYTFDDRLARSLAMDFERRWLERLVAASSPAPIETSASEEIDPLVVEVAEEKPAKKSKHSNSAETDKP